MRTPLFYRHKPIFGLDIGKSTIKLVQLERKQSHIRVVGYGHSEYDKSTNQNGELLNTDSAAQTIKSLLKQLTVGKVSTNRLVASVPTEHTFTRIVSLPEIDEKDLASAVKLEAEQYIPLPPDQLYLDYTVLSKNADKKEQYILLVATPKTIVASYIQLFDKLNLELAGLEPSLFAILRAVNFTRTPGTPRILIDFGATSSDLAIYDQVIRLTSTITTGGDRLTKEIATALSVPAEQAEMIKTRFGITKSQWQTKLISALQPALSELANEVQKMMRYYRDHSGSPNGITEITIVGGGANLPGLADFLSHLTGLSVTICNPWERLVIKPLQPPHQLETTLYTTAVGLALKELEA